MKSITIIIITLFCFSSAIAQLEVKETATYTPVMEYGEKMFVPMHFGKGDILPGSELASLKASDVLKVEIISTAYPHDYDLSSLVADRVSSIHAAVEGLNKNPDVVYQSIVQTGCKTEDEARTMFHGAVITYRPTYSEESGRDEIGKLDKLLSGEKTLATSYTAATGDVEMTEGDDLLSELVWIAVDTKDGKVVWGAYDIYGGTVGSPSARSLYYQTDSTFFRIMDRNDHWTDMMIAADLTGSMYPYTAQILAWLQLDSNDDKVKQFVFFNDGDMTPDPMKKIGRTGGIYIGNYSKYPEVKELAQKTMMGGGGGDAPENNVEALIKGISKCPDCEDIIMVADNWAPVKDIAWMKKVNLPVRIVLCGVWGSIHPDYLTLARATGGSVHTMEEDLYKLALINEGEVITVGKFSYQLTKGKFVRISTS